MIQKANIEHLQYEIGHWIQKHTKIIKVSPDTLEVGTTEVDAYGDQIYCFVQQGQEEDTFIVSDDGNLLFKLDPDAHDHELYQTAEEIALGAGFEYDHQASQFFLTTNAANLAEAVIRLSQLQVAISYLG